MFDENNHDPEHMPAGWKNQNEKPTPVGRIIFLSLGVLKYVSQEPMILFSMPIFSICFLTDNEGSERLTMSIKKKFTFTTSDGNPISRILEPYTPASFLYVSKHV